MTRSEAARADEVLRRIGRRPSPRADHNLVVITIDSCRYDTFLEASPENIARPFGGLDRVERRVSYAPWTAPSHYNLLMGLMPHTSPTGVFASEYYKRDFLRYNERLGTRASERIDFESLVPALWLPTFLRYELGYATHAMVSMPVINRSTPINSDFDRYRLMDAHNDMGKMLDAIEGGDVFSDDCPTFLLMNTGETHFPYTVPGDDPEELPPLGGPQGILRSGADPVEMSRLRERQVRAVRYLDRHVFPRLYDLVPENTWVIVLSDHGELFGEGGYFGHGPILHDKVLEVPFLEGKIR